MIHLRFFSSAEEIKGKRDKGEGEKVEKCGTLCDALDFHTCIATRKGVAK